jgi:hypothetical protein
MIAPEIRLVVNAPPLRLRRLRSTATYLKNAGHDLFTVTKLKEQQIGPALVMVATSAVEREFREINRRTEVGARWSDEGVERVAKLLEEVRLNGTSWNFEDDLLADFKTQNYDKVKRSSSGE